MRLRGRRALITGAGSGIGRAAALLFAREGASVVAADLDLAAAEETAGLAEGGVSPVQVDVSDEGSVAAGVAAAEEALGGAVDALANIAGVGSTTATPDTALDTWDGVFGVNARGTFLCCRAVLPGMIEAGSGSIVNMGSVAGMVGLRNRAAYCASKGAVISFSRALAVDHVGQGVRVNCVCPGTVDSPWVRRLVEEVGESIDALRARQPMGRLGTPEEIAEAVAYLTAEEAAFVTGSVFVIDGGLTAA